MDIRRCGTEDREGVLRLLETCSLPTADLQTATLDRFFVCGLAGEIGGVAGLGVCGGDVLLRSVAVRETARAVWIPCRSHRSWPCCCDRGRRVATTTFLPVRSATGQRKTLSTFSGSYARGVAAGRFYPVDLLFLLGVLRSGAVGMTYWPLPRRPVENGWHTREQFSIRLKEILSYPFKDAPFPQVPPSL